MNGNYAPITFVVPGDLHLTSRNQPNYAAASAVVSEINRLVGPDFVQFIGDNVQDGTHEQFALFGELASHLEVPHYALVGDHDLDDSKSFDRFVEHVGDPYGSHRLRGIRFVRLNSQEFQPVGFSEDQLDWLAGELEEAAAHRDQVVLFQHNYPYQIWEDFDGPGIDRWRQLIQSPSIVTIVCGHTHYLQTANDGRNVWTAVRSIGDPEGGSPGYLIGFLHGDDLAFKYRTIDDSGPIVMITHPRDSLLATHARHIIYGPTEVSVRTWSSTPIRQVRWKLDGGFGPDLASVDGNHWYAVLSDAQLRKGEHQIEVLAMDERGDVAGTDSLTFVFDPTNRHTAVPTTRPRVCSTAFC